MSTDYEMLELAAKAAGIPRQQWDYEFCRGRGHMVTRSMMWNPLDDDGAAFRLMVALHLDIEFATAATWIGLKKDSNVPLTFQAHRNDGFAATRRTITYAAAAIGRAMP